MVGTHETLELWPDINRQSGHEHDWTFNGASTRELTHCYHDYPARMIPQVAAKLLDQFGSSSATLFDPYCGSGTSLVEGMIRGIKVMGTDLNPLARLMAKAKTCVCDIAEVDAKIVSFYKTLKSKPSKVEVPTELNGLKNVDFWFKEPVVHDLARIKNFINDLDNESVKLFFQVAFSETVRDSSNTRNGEFKLYRYHPEKLANFNPDPLRIMSLKLNRNREGLKGFLRMVGKRVKSKAKVFDFNTVEGIPTKSVLAKSIDIVVTSPPYGDSHTTVAYGQYSRLSAAWLDLSEPEKTDRKLMGGKVTKTMPVFSSGLLNEALSEIQRKDEKRSLEVASFYIDLHRSIENVGTLLRPHGYACYVVGNRKVKGVVVPTDEAVRSFFQDSGFEHVDTFQRSIPNKRMPLRNSPSNAVGDVDKTMTQEHIVVMRRKA